MDKTKLTHQARTILITLLLSFIVCKTNAQGPNAPEAAAFEPVDATDLVDLLSGDLSYVLPLVNIPSPEGGYPIALSYHAGIALEQDASWVGLGWTLNPGALNRNVNFIPDDWENGQHRNIFYDAGGVSHSYSANLGVEISDDWSVGLWASYQQNKSINGENSYSFNWGSSVGYKDNSFNISDSGIGLTYDLHTNVEDENGEVTGTKYLSTIGVGFDSNTGVFASMSHKKSSMGITIGSGESYFSIGGGKISISSKGSVNPILNTRILGSHSLSIGYANFIRLNLSYSRTKYWFYDSTLSKFAGSLYPSNLEQRQFLEMYEDSSLLNDNESMMDNNIGFLSFDQYKVSAQGISGNISPNLNEFGAIKGKNKVLQYDGSLPDKAISYFHSQSAQFSKSISNNGSNKINFYFDNVNASHYRTIASNWDILSQASNITDVNSNIATSVSVNDNGDILSNFNANNSRYTKGPFVDYFLNSEINNNLIQVKQRGFIEAKDYDRGLIDDKFNSTQDGIGAFKVTSSDGKTYHYSLPVYQKESYQFSTEKDENIVTRFLGNQQFKPYATHWLLTAITGPDYIDTNDNGEFDNQDYGYWVEFEYGRWLDNYAWGSPKVYGQFNYYDNNKSHSFGVKEVYYLDRVKTRTHSALFIKKERNDARGTEIDYGQDRVYSMDTYLNSLFGAILNSDYYVSLFQEYGVNYSFIGTGSSEVRSEFYDFIDVSSNQKLLALDKILLVKNDDLDELNYSKDSNESTQNPEPCTIRYNHFAKILINNNIEGPFPLDSYIRTWSDHANYNKVLTINDLQVNFPDINNKVERAVELNHDYKLAGNTPNQYGNSTGRLTLNSLSFKGKNNVQHIPPYKFKYNDEYTSYDKSKEDSWGYYGSNPDVWSLKEVETPLGSSLAFNYESDGYHQTAVPSHRVFTDKLKFIFSNVNNKLRILVTNSNSNAGEINFLNYYEPNSSVNIDVWACIKHEYNAGPFNGGCQSRDGYVNIQDESVNVINVNDTSVTFETVLGGQTHNHNDGLNWLFGTEYSYEMTDLQNKGRGQCPDLPGGCPQETAHTLKYQIKSNKQLNDETAGGIRVKKIALRMNGQEINSSNYYYNSLGFNQNPNDSNYRSSGITSYSPSKFNTEIKYHTELPPPFVTYKNVTVEKKGQNMASIGKESYIFETIEPFVETSNTFSIGDILTISTVQKIDDNSITLDGDPAFYSPYRYEVNNKLSNVGRLLSKYSYNSENQIISKTINTYKELVKESQGVHQESFSYYKQAFSWGSTTKYKVNATSKIIYPSVLESTSVTQNGYTNVNYFDKYDFNTGQVLETTNEDSKGNKFKTEVVPAYTIPEYNPSGGYGMGSKVDNTTNKNMLTQQAMTKTYMEVDGDWQETGVGITTWNNVWSYRALNGIETEETSSDKKVWRKHKKFVWDGDINDAGTYQGFVGLDDGFNWEPFVGGHFVTNTTTGEIVFTTNQTNPKWKNVFTTTLYDHYSMPLEARDINNNYTSTKMDKNNEKVLSTSNAAYTEQFYSGAEEGNNSWVGGHISIWNYVPTHAHTGIYSEKAEVGSKNFKCSPKPQLKPGQTEKQFKVSVWVHKSTQSNARLFNGTTIVDFSGEEVFAGDWVQLNHYVDLSAETEIYVTASTGYVYFDDFRIHPIESAMTSYVYNEWDELSYILGSNNLGTHFVYDEAGRLIETHTEVIDSENVTGGFKKVSENNYNYQTNQTN